MWNKNSGIEKYNRFDHGRCAGTCLRKIVKWIKAAVLEQCWVSVEQFSKGKLGSKIKNWVFEARFE